jgi:hypothetical protein
MRDVSSQLSGQQSADLEDCLLGAETPARSAREAPIGDLVKGAVQTEAALSDGLNFEQASFHFKKDSTAEGSRLAASEELAALSSGLACPRLLSHVVSQSRELHIPHSHTAASVPALVTAIEDHLQRHASRDKCVIMVESLTPSHPLLSKVAVGEALTHIAQGRPSEAIELLDPYARSPGCSDFLRELTTYDSKQSLGANFLQLCRDNKEYLFELSDALRVSGHELGVEYTIELMDLDSSYEQRAVHQCHSMLTGSRRALERMVTQPQDSSSDGSVLGELVENARKQIAATACVISPIRNQAMFKQICERALSLADSEDTLLVGLYGSGHLQVGAQRFLPGCFLPGSTGAGVAMAGTYSDSFSDGVDPSPFIPRTSNSFASAVVATIAAHGLEERFEELTLPYRLKLCERLVTDDQAKRFLWHYLHSNSSEEANSNQESWENAPITRAFMASPEMISGFLEEVGRGARERGISWRSSANILTS